jgi:hypothetical protein
VATISIVLVIFRVFWTDRIRPFSSLALAMFDYVLSAIGYRLSAISGTRRSAIIGVAYQPERIAR